ncbi:MAG: ABC transporter permease [Phycisphaeraceae bacterium]|nr:ABC transporter permease [Phycisphaeraceae bacterium]
MVSALDRKLVRELGRLWPQLFAAAMVMAVGVGALTMSLSTLRSLERARDTYYERYRFPDVFTHVKRAPASLKDRIAQIPGVSRVAARIVVDVSLDVTGLNEPANGRLISIPDAPPFGLCEVHLRRGRFPDPLHPGEVVASEAFADAHGFSLGQTLSAVINGRLQTLTIVGVGLSPEYIYQIQPGSFLPDDLRFGVFWMNHRQLAPAFNLDGAFNNIALSLGPGASVPDVLRRLDTLTEPYGGTGAYARKDQTSHQYVSDELAQLRGMAVIPPTVFLSASAFILNIVFARLIRTQRIQIAALRAFGYSSLQIAGHYLSMVVVVSLLGGVLGVLLGWRMGLLVTELYIRFFRFPVFEFTLSRSAIALALSVGVGAAVAGTLLTIRRAAALPPAQAMRPETPPDYRSTTIERLRVQRLLSPAGRMILRHLERQPLRAAMTALGMSLALAVLILGSYSHGAVNEVVDFQFDRLQRQDATVTLVEPAAPRAAAALASLPGVVSAEFFRAVPVRFRAGPIERREVITALDPQPALSRVLTTSGRPVHMPESGLLLTDSLAELLRVKRGDRVRVEVLEGQRPVVDLTVTDIVTTYVGTAAYMDRRALNALMQEGPVISGAFLKVDPSAAARLYASLKEVPAVAGVTVKRAALDTFRDTFAKNILIMRVFNLIFASTIAFGVMFNSARIALAERAHEFATLRILGFRRAEVSAILLGELAVLTIVAIPIGLVLGRLLTLYAASALQTETHRIPALINASTFAYAIIVVCSAAAISGLIVRRGVSTLNLVEVLKSEG